VLHDRLLSYSNANRHTPCYLTLTHGSTTSTSFALNALWLEMFIVPEIAFRPPLASLCIPPPTSLPL
jgi:hypothetical protein